MPGRVSADTREKEKRGKRSVPLMVERANRFWAALGPDQRATGWLQVRHGKMASAPE